MARQSHLLREAGYPVQVNPRPINLFYLDEKGRDRILRHKDGFAIMGRDLLWSQKEMEQILTAHPENFSPNVLLRPLYQESILPNLAYCGGWGELAYWMQLKGLFEEGGVHFPLLLPRMSATLFREAEAEAWGELGFALSDVHKKIPQLYEDYMPALWDATTYEQLAADALAVFDRLAAYTAHYSQTLPRSSLGQQAKTARFLHQLRKKLHRVIRHDQPAAFQRIASLKQAIQPDGASQERILGLASFPALAPNELVKRCYQACEPLDFAHHYLKV